MNAREEGFLLLSSALGNPERKPLTTAQLRTLALRVATMERADAERELTASDLRALGYGSDMIRRILGLLEDLPLLRRYHANGWQADCTPITRVSEGYPVILRKRLGLESPGVLWAKGDMSLLEKPKISLVGSRDIEKPNADFAAAVGREAARQGYVLVSGNARGADRIAQQACLDAGGQVISVVADELMKQTLQPNALYLSEEGFDTAFTSIRALSRNRVIHALGEKVMVAQCALGVGGTWSGTVHNLKENWSSVFCFRDGSEASAQLEQMGAELIAICDLSDFRALPEQAENLFEKA
jgi:predicted Rossmann fold nucleotide-binding protein DprA/Smf involved in DNA uptake